MNWPRLFAGIAAGGTLALLGACSGMSNSEIVAGAASGRLYAVSAARAPFYHYGPQQVNGPDERLPRNTVMALIGRSFGYCKVQLLTGEQGYVASQDIRTASRELIAATTAPPPRTSIAQNHARKFHLNDNDPRLVTPPEPLPLDVPEPTPIPATQASSPPVVP